MVGSIGTKVKVRNSPLTNGKGLAGKVGEVYGQTTPSIMGIEVIGKPEGDIAVNVYFDDLKFSYWFAVDLLEKIDDGQGTVITLDGIAKKWTKAENGQWLEETTKLAKKWWEFWK